MMAKEYTTMTRPSIYEATEHEGLRAEPSHGLAVRISGEDAYVDGQERLERAVAAAGYELHEDVETDDPGGDLWLPVELLDAELWEQEATRRMFLLVAALRTSLLVVGVLVVYCLTASVEWVAVLTLVPALSVLAYVSRRGQHRVALRARQPFPVDRWKVALRNQADDVREERWRLFAERLYLRLARCQLLGDAPADLPSDVEMRGLADEYRQLSKEGGWDVDGTTLTAQTLGMARHRARYWTERKETQS